MPKIKLDDIGGSLYAMCEELLPLPRSITGQGFRDSVALINEYLGHGGGCDDKFNPALKLHSVPSGTQVYDWVVPDEWECEEAYIITPDGKKICDFNAHRLHVVGYSTAVDVSLSLEELSEHIYSLPDMPDAIPYITSYYQSRWGFCMSENERKSLKPGTYRAVIKSRHFKGELNYADCIIKATSKSKGEILISSYLCHPQMANNELSGPTVLAGLLAYVRELPERNYDYRFVIVPETIGSICYINKNLNTLKERVRAGFVLTCIGDDRAYSYLASPSGDTLADRATKHALSMIDSGYKSYDFTSRGSDERQYCSPLVNLPVCDIMRSKYGCYPEYHTSLDALGSVVTPSGLLGGFNAVKDAVLAIEANKIYEPLVFCEPNLGKRGLYPTLSSASNSKSAYIYRDFLAFVDGKKDVIEIANILGIKASELREIAQKCEEKGLIKERE
ncbi:DUF4910 domain-containing protein [Campylobacter sp. 19-13652]|uniref:DUF4910 domain-containing protein n=1 Tax=Campylobacter sp. 19-13652 TaxID=2840180 RepID=UPI001C77911C|nr:DUF4910 domain-containing protein [Campylobacter sp. 19-13652]BCX79025.1 aminopeptidase [Campylobacter sp. 19-13652]